MTTTGLGVVTVVDLVAVAVMFGKFAVFVIDSGRTVVACVAVYAVVDLEIGIILLSSVVYSFPLFGICVLLSLNNCFFLNWFVSILLQGITGGM